MNTIKSCDRIIFDLIITFKIAYAKEVYFLFRSKLCTINYLCGVKKFKSASTAISEEMLSAASKTWTELSRRVSMSFLCHWRW